MYSVPRTEYSVLLALRLLLALRYGNELASMPDHRQHRGRHPDDDRLFGREAWPLLREAVQDLSWLLTRDYAPPSALKLVGDRYQLEQRQRIAVARSACSDQAKAERSAKQLSPNDLAGRRLAIDGFNILTTLEAVLGGGVILLARDGCLRDMASVHGAYRHVAETEPALELAARCLAALQPAECVWYLDAPVSNSGRLAGKLRDTSERSNLNWRVELVHSADHALIQKTEAIVASADSVVLDRSAAWTNLTTAILADAQIEPAAIDLQDSHRG